jgi:hypothetical protein
VDDGVSLILKMSLKGCCRQSEMPENSKCMNYMYRMFENL